MTRCWPMDRGCVVTSEFGPRGAEFHWGLDIGWPGGSAGLPVYATQAGRVDSAREASGFGWWVCIDHPENQGGGYTVYGHIIPEVTEGQWVEAGQRIARINPNMLTNGNVTPHLHVEVHEFVWAPPGVGRLNPAAWLERAGYPDETSPSGEAMRDTLFADVSYFQVPVDDSYPYEVFSFRSNDGTFRDPAFAHNYRWAARQADAGKLSCFIVYFYWRANWSDCVEVMRDMVESVGGPHPRMIAMIDVESGGNPHGDQSAGINGAYWDLADWLGDTKRVIGYANTGDFNSMWRTRPDGLRVIAAGYGRVPDLPGQIAHQYTDGQGFGAGLPEGCPPFGNCDMNSANGMTPNQFAAACGVGTGDEMTPEQAQMLKDVWEQLRGPNGQGWPQLGKNDRGEDLTPIDKLATYDARFAKLEAAVAQLLGGAK